MAALTLRATPLRSVNEGRCLLPELSSTIKPSGSHARQAFGQRAVSCSVGGPAGATSLSARMTRRRNAFRWSTRDGGRRGSSLGQSPYPPPPEPRGDPARGSISENAMNIGVRRRKPSLARLLLGEVGDRMFAK
jgi:hypothetical protein